MFMENGQGPGKTIIARTRRKGLQTVVLQTAIKYREEVVEAAGQVPPAGWVEALLGPIPHGQIFSMGAEVDGGSHQLGPFVFWDDQGLSKVEEGALPLPMSMEADGEYVAVGCEALTTGKAGGDDHPVTGTNASTALPPAKLH